MPTVTICRTPACSAAATSSASGGSHKSRWVCESITRSRRLRRGRVLREQRADRADLLDVPAAQGRAREGGVRGAERSEQLLRGGRQVWPQQDGDRAQALREVGEHRGELL